MTPINRWYLGLFRNLYTEKGRSSQRTTESYSRNDILIIFHLLIFSLDGLLYPMSNYIAIFRGGLIKYSFERLFNRCVHRLIERRCIPLTGSGHFDKCQYSQLSQCPWHDIPVPLFVRNPMLKTLLVPNNSRQRCPTLISPDELSPCELSLTEVPWLGMRTSTFTHVSSPSVTDMRVMRPDNNLRFFPTCSGNAVGNADQRPRKMVIAAF